VKNSRRSGKLEYCIKRDQCDNNKWVLWACIRGTAVSRLLYGWIGESLEKGLWKPLGIVARAQVKFGEKSGSSETMGAPFFLKTGDKYLGFYHSSGIHLMTSEDGINYKRQLNSQGKSLLFSNGGRDIMVTKIKDKFFAYSTISTKIRRGYIVVRTSKNLKNWSDYTIVCEGGIAGNGNVSAESPFVVEKDNLFYLFRSSSMDFQTYVYRSTNPYNFGVNNDSKLIKRFPIKAPEIVYHNQRYYISDLADFQGIKLAKLEWKESNESFNWRTD